MNKIILTLLIVAALLGVPHSSAETALPGQWRIHNTFDQYFQETIDTPTRVYLLALGQRHDANSTSWQQTTGQLFVLDKESGEIMGYNAGNYLNGNVITDIAYNPQKGYLLIIYDDYRIDMLYDDDKIYSIPGLASSATTSSKEVNNVCFDPEQNKAWLATDFGYIVIDDKKYVISESRTYNMSLSSVARVGDYLLLGKADGLYVAPATDRNPSFDSYKPAGDYTSGVNHILPLTDTTFGLAGSNGLYVGTIHEGGTVTLDKKDGSNLQYAAENRDGYMLRRTGCSYQLTHTGELSPVYVDKTGYGNTPFGSWNMKDFYFPSSREGIVRLSYLGNYKWDTTGSQYTPNAPEPYAAFYFDYSPEYGMLVGNGTFNRFYTDYSRYPSLVSGYESGDWTSYGTTQSSSPMATALVEAYGPVVDPLDPDYIWIGSRRAGLARFKLSDNSMELYSHAQHECAGQPGFHTVFPTSIYWTELCNVSAPSFDSDGNLWCVFNPSHAVEGESPLYCWKAADRKAGRVSAFKKVPVKGYAKHMDNLTVLATKSQSSRNFVVFSQTTRYKEPFYLFYHAGTIDDTSDDRLYSYNTFIDQDGSSVSYIYINTFYEDPTTGYIWVGTDTGLFYFDPNEALRAGNTGGSLRVRRVKVARNDGTNLADYLLDGSDVTSITSDGAARKWFGTHGGGIVVSSPDGSRIIDQFTTSNSQLPSDNIFAIGFDPTGNAVWIGSDKQISTYFCDATPAAESYSQVLAFPNPVRPEYSGPVTIQGLMDNSLVKIADASGAIVKELGISNGGMALWDLTDMHGREVCAGVYYILSSTTTESVSSAGNSTKILVVR